MQTLAYLLLAAALLTISAEIWVTAGLLLVMALLVWTWDRPNRRSNL